METKPFKKYFVLRIPTGKEYEEMHKKANEIDISKYFDAKDIPPDVNPEHVLKYMNNASPPYRNIYARKDYRAIPLAIPIHQETSLLRSIVETLAYPLEELYERIKQWLKPLRL